jgi:hypothetical protein
MAKISKCSAVVLIGAMCMFGVMGGKALAVNDEPLTEKWAPQRMGAG